MNAKCGFGSICTCKEPLFLQVSLLILAVQQESEFPSWISWRCASKEKNSGCKNLTEGHRTIQVTFEHGESWDTNRPRPTVKNH